MGMEAVREFAYERRADTEDRNRVARRLMERGMIQSLLAMRQRSVVLAKLPNTRPDHHHSYRQPAKKHRRGSFGNNNREKGRSLPKALLDDQY